MQLFNLAILSRDAQQYKVLIDQANLPQLKVVMVNTFADQNTY